MSLPFSQVSRSVGASQYFFSHVLGRWCVALPRWNSEPRHLEYTAVCLRWQYPENRLRSQLPVSSVN